MNTYKHMKIKFVKSNTIMMIKKSLTIGILLFSRKKHRIDILILPNHYFRELNFWFTYIFHKFFILKFIVSNSPIIELLINNHENIQRINYIS